MWPAVYTHLNIAYVVKIFSQYCSNPEPTYCNQVIQVFRYLSGTLELGITYTTDSKNKLVGYTDFDYARFIDG